MRVADRLQILRGGLAQLWRDQGGQAMVEYSTMTFFLSGGAAVGALGFVLPQLLNAINAYVGSIYFILNMPLP